MRTFILKKPISLTTFSTPLGTAVAGSTEKGICLLEFLSAELENTQETMPTNGGPYLEELKKQLNEYFAGTRMDFDLPISFENGTKFQQTAWQELTKIPYGETRSYKEQAQGMKNPLAIRAVGRANGRNPISIIVPCHRVIGASGKLVGYGGGLWRKQFLLDLESKQAKSSKH
ncbi:MAG: methylated-DNA--[protein]-cysteine S-methyltransferase [Oligoflexales bacterium]